MKTKRRRATATSTTTTAAVLGCSTLLSALLVGATREIPYDLDERQGQHTYSIPRRKSRRKRFIDASENTQTQRQRSSFIRKASPGRKLHDPHPNTDETIHPRRPKDGCEWAARIYAVDGAQCSCTYHPITADTVTFQCYFPGCEECTYVGSGANDLVCAELSTRTELSDLRGNEQLSEVSYTECFTYTRGRSDTVCYTEFFDPQANIFRDQCLLDVNGSNCNNCLQDTCTNEFGGAEVGLSELDCSNIAGGNDWNLCGSGGVFDIQVQMDSVFLAFADVRTFSFNKCFSDDAEGDKAGEYSLLEDMPQMSLTESTVGGAKTVSGPADIRQGLPALVRTSHILYSPRNLTFIQNYPSRPKPTRPWQNSNVFNQGKASKGNRFQGMGNFPARHKWRPKARK